MNKVEIEKAALRAEVALGAFLLDADALLYTEDKDTLKRALDIIRAQRKKT